jgi:hypothetical protein
MCLNSWISRACRLIGAISMAWLFVSLAQADFRDESEAWGYSGDGTAAFVDFDGDGWVDLYAGGALFRNEEGTRFVKVANDSAVPAGGSAIWGDFDNDGLPDLFNFSGTGSLHKNLGDGSFRDWPFPDLVTVNSRGAVGADLDNDGWLDLYVGGYEIWQRGVHPDAAYRNRDGEEFVEHWRSPEGRNFSARGVTAADFDQDGDVDVYVSNYRLQPNFLWRNDGAGKLADAAVELGSAGTPDEVIDYTGGIRYPICGHSIGSAWGDLDADGLIDLLVGNFSHPPANQDRPQLLRNLGPDAGYRFEDHWADSGMTWQESFASPALGDYDNDGDLDIYYTTVYATGSGGIKNYPVLYRNEGNWHFVDVTEAEGLANLGPTYQAAWADIDNDGDLDLCTNGKLFINDRSQGNWIEVQLIGDGKTVNRSAIGAQVRVRLDDRVLTRQVEAGTGEGNQNDLRLHFGLGAQGGTVDLEITWPGGKTQNVDGLAVNRPHQVEVDFSDSADK